MTEDTRARLISITPALPGWYAVYRDENGEWLQPIALWAHMEEPTADGRRRTFPTSFSIADGEGLSNAAADHDQPDFVGYRYIDSQDAPR